MQKYLFMVSIGPVQDFIASARRTRDLWFGSWLLSELAKEAAQGIVTANTRNSLIFPAPHDEKLLQPDSLLNVANKIVALIDDTPQQLGEAVRKAIFCRLHTIRDQAFEKLGPFDQDAAYKQIDDLVEYFWVALPFDGTNYAATRKNLEALMAARKNTRDFNKVEWGSSDPKSSIDGQFESVIPKELYERRGLLAEERQRKIKTLYDNYNAGPAERLSGIDLLKRRGNPGGETHFPSTSHMAAIPFLKRLEQLENPSQAKYLFDKYIAKIREIATSKKQVAMIDFVPARWQQHAVLGRYDGSLLFEERLVDVVDNTTGFEPAKEALRAFYKEVDKAFGTARPIPYYAILRADGDFMGRAIDELSKYEEGAGRHRELSQALDGFAGDVREIVEIQHAGALVYAGGDDVLALIPLHTVLSCAQKLAEEFFERLKPFEYDNNKSPTLSVGIAVVHHLDSLREALELARIAEEKQAKGVTGKNAMAIRISKRSGEERAVVGKWGVLNKRMTQLITYYRNGDISEGTSYELRELAQRLTGPTDVDGLEDAMLTEAKRILQRKLSMRQKTLAQNGGAEGENILNTLLAMLSEEQREPGEPDIIQKSHVQVEELAWELMVARTFADAMELAAPKKKEYV